MHYPPRMRLLLFMTISPLTHITVYYSTSSANQHPSQAHEAHTCQRKDTCLHSSQVIHC
ncbi:hypothetical protein PR003_g34922 [Phytophthora rubi]|uniref:RxLR effector protein n=1 Tax=Phytophthora rubi TaxID=129364 RepID=A0A6A4AKV9_9STRA|nr:hypothetical protein PR001_g28508 [Phytophthora rubi]KAE9259119.1 hypothetical protein PR003_g34922 [Phytophthora rubi]